MMRKERVYVTLFILIISGLFTYVYRGFLGAGMLSYGDSSPFPETANQAFDAFTSAWQPLSIGIIFPWTLVIFMEGLTILICGGNSVLAQKIFYLAPLPLAFLAMYFFLRKLGVSLNARLIASFAYSINPVTIGNFIGGAHTGFYVLAFAPVLSVVLIDVGNGKNLLRNTVILTLLAALSISFNLIVAAFCALPFAIYAIINPLFKRNTKGFITVIIILFTSLILAVLLTLPYSFFAYFMATQFLPGHLPTQEALRGLIGNILNCYASSSMINIMKFGSTSLSFLGYLGSTPWTLLGLLYPLLAYASLLFRNDRRDSTIKVILALYSFVPITLIWLAHLGPGLQIYLHFPMLFAYSNPSGLNMILAFAYAPLIALTIDRVEVFFRRLIAQGKLLQQRGVDAAGSFHKLAFVNALLLFIIITSFFATYNWPFFTGDMAFSLAGRPMDQSTIPSVIYEAGRWLNEHRTQGEDFRTLWLPLDYETQLHTRWLDPGALTVPLGASQYVNLPITRYIGFVFHALANNETNRIGALLAPLNVKYIMVNLKSPQTGFPRATGFLEYGEPFLYGSPLEYVRILNGQKDLKLVENQTDFLIYKNLEYLPSVTVYSNSFFVMPITNETHEPLIDLSLMKALSELPGFKPRNQILIFGGELSPKIRTLFLENSAAVIIPPSDVGQLPEEYSHIKESQAIIGFSAVDFTQRLIFSDDFSNLSEWTVVSGNWVAPRSGFYRLMVLAPGDGLMSFSVNGSQVNTTQIGDGWWESELVYLTIGTYHVTIHYMGSLDFSDYFVAYQTPNDLALREFLNNSPNVPAKYTFHKISETKYSLKVNLKGPTFIHLGEMYHQGWNAYVDGEKLEHFVSNHFGNGFYVNKTGEFSIIIKYDPQDLKNFTIYVSATSWLVAFIGLAYCSRGRLKDLILRPFSTLKKHEERLLYL